MAAQGVLLLRTCQYPGCSTRSETPARDFALVAFVRGGASAVITVCGRHFAGLHGQCGGPELVELAAEEEHEEQQAAAGCTMCGGRGGSLARPCGLCGGTMPYIDGAPWRR